MMMGMGVGFELWGILLMFLLWGGLIALAVWGVTVLFPRRARLSENDDHLDAQEILDRRYARGEINREQYESMKQNIS